MANQEEAHSGTGAAESSGAQRRLKVLIAEDDPVQGEALASLVGMLRPHWQVLDVATTVEAFRAGVDSLLPDLCLTDIHLAGDADASWIKSIPPDLAIIFVTGDPEHAVHAFDRRAIDYVLKPITARRLRSALERAEQDPRLAATSSPSQATAGSSDAARHLSHITIARGRDSVVVMREDIIYLEADTKYTRVVTHAAAGLVRVSISELAARLPAEQFVKIHRSTVVNLRFIDFVKRNELGHLDVHLKGRSETLRVSKPHEPIFRPD